jgi:hypothetical protein
MRKTYEENVIYINVDTFTIDSETGDDLEHRKGLEIRVVENDNPDCDTDQTNELACLLGIIGELPIDTVRGFAEANCDNLKGSNEVK